MNGCEYFKKNQCRSCSEIDRSPDESIKQKELIIEKIFNLKPEESVHLSDWGFRDKIKLTVAGTIEQPLIGLLSEDLRQVTELFNCPVQAPELNNELPALKSFITRWKLTPYSISDRKGELKGLIISWSPTTKEKMLRFVLRSKESLDRIRLGLSELSQFSVVSINLQPIPHAHLEGSEEIILTEKKSLIHLSGSISLSFSPQSFMQTNTRVAGELYQTAAEWLNEYKNSRTLDLFCGVGGFALHLARDGHNVLGVEINPSAIHEASLMAQQQRLSAQFLASSSAEIHHKWTEWKPNIVVVNPPRKGLGESLKLIQEHLPPILLYSSCNHESLEADYTHLKEYYFASRAKIFNMFNFTNHFETLVLLVRR